MGKDTPAVGGGSYTNPVSGWTFLYSNNMPLGPAKDAATGTYYFDFPSSDGVHYLVNNASGLSLDKTISADFTLSGNGEWGISASNDGPPATVSLFIQRRGDNLSAVGEYEHYRWWAGRTILGASSKFSISVPLSDVWTSVYAKSSKDNAAAFAAALANAAYVGLTFGGQSFAGHGLYAKSGSIRFTLNSFVVK